MNLSIALTGKSVVNINIYNYYSHAKYIQSNFTPPASPVWSFQQKKFVYPEKNHFSTPIMSPLTGTEYPNSPKSNIEINEDGLTDQEEEDQPKNLNANK
jgi:hypothetical protein